MVDTCVARRPVSSSVDQTTGAVTVTYTDIYSGKCRMTRGTRAGSRPPTYKLGESEVVLASSYVQVPAAIDFFQVDDLIEITSSQAPGLVGRKMRVASPWMQTSSSMCRYTTQESSQPDPVSA